MQFIHRLSELTEDWIYFSRRDGLKSALPVILSDLRNLPYRHLHFIIVAHSLLVPFPDLQPNIGVSLRIFEQGDLDLVRKIDRPSEARLCAQRLKQGHKGLFAFYQYQPAGYAWGSTDTDTRLERVHPHLDPGDVLFTDSYTYPEYRGKGIQTALTLARFRLFQELGYHRAVSTIEVSNQASLAVWLRKMNGQSIGSINFLRLGPWYRIQYR
jgi:GNAT superfamily N-acetyltransferase